MIVPVIKDLLACLSSSEVQQMLDELASDPDDKHVPPSVRLVILRGKVTDIKFLTAGMPTSVKRSPRAPWITMGWSPTSSKKAWPVQIKRRRFPSRPG